jgi:hypothetical protein
MSAEDELFETPAGQITIQADPDEEPVDLAEMQAEVAKPKRKKRELTPEQREALLERLRKGRETAQKNRRARAEEKRKVKAADGAAAKISKPVKMTDRPPTNVQRPSPSPSHNSEMFAEVKALRAELAEMRADKAESRRRKAEERLKKAQVKFVDPQLEPKPGPPMPSTRAAKVKDLAPKNAPQQPPAEPTTEQYFCANTGKIKTRPKRK